MQSSEAENYLWEALMDTTPDAISKFERQVSIGPYFVDIVYVPDRWAIPVNGHKHHSKPDVFEKDHKRTRYLVDEGYTVYPFSGKEVLSDARKCALEIVKKLNLPIMEYVSAVEHVSDEKVIRMAHRESGRLITCRNVEQEHNRARYMLDMQGHYVNYDSISAFGKVKRVTEFESENGPGIFVDVLIVDGLLTVSVFGEALRHRELLQEDRFVYFLGNWWYGSKNDTMYFNCKYAKDGQGKVEKLRNAKDNNELTIGESLSAVIGAPVLETSLDETVRKVYNETH